MRLGKGNVLMLLTIISVTGMPVSAQQKHDEKFEKLIRKNASAPLLNILDHPEKYRFQIIYTEINRDKNNKPGFKYHYLHVDRDQYFYPASTVKLPTALTALQKLNELKVRGLDKNAVMLTDSASAGQTAMVQDSSSENGLPSIAHYIKKVFLVSDNDAYNRLYEFCGQKYLNETLWKKGYKDIRIVKRFVPMTEEQNRRSNPIRFYNDEQLVYSQKEQVSDLSFDFSKPAQAGKGYYKGQELVNEPLDFSRHNRFPLPDQQQMLQSVMFPGTTANKDFKLSKDDYTFLYQCMSMLPRQSTFPKYNASEYFDSYAKFFMSRSGKEEFPPYLRVFNKAGWAYGFMTDNSYIADQKNKVEFMLTATIYVNEDDILNDDKYDYETIGYPFFKEVSEIIYTYELKRKRKYKPQFSF